MDISADDSFLNFIPSRAEKYSPEELQFLLTLILRYPFIIESKNSQTETKIRKTAVWQHIANQYNNEFPNCQPKTAGQLRNWWKRTKSRAKQRLAVQNVGASDGDMASKWAGRGYIERIYMEICQLRERMATNYDPRNEENEFKDFLVETTGPTKKVEWSVWSTNINDESNTDNDANPASPTDNSVDLPEPSASRPPTTLRIRKDQFINLTSSNDADSSSDTGTMVLTSRIQSESGTQTEEVSALETIKKEKEEEDVQLQRQVLRLQRDILKLKKRKLEVELQIVENKLTKTSHSTEAVDRKIEMGPPQVP